MKQHLDPNLVELAETICTLHTTQDAIAFLEGILTPKELQELMLRLQIVKKLKKGESQREIAADLGVGIATVTRGSKEIQKGKFEYV